VGPKRATRLGVMLKKKLFTMRVSLSSLSSLALFILHVSFILACTVSLQPVDRAAQVRPRFFR
jgi:hypothetical protein